MRAALAFEPAPVRAIDDDLAGQSGVERAERGLSQCEDEANPEDNRDRGAKAEGKNQRHEQRMSHAFCATARSGLGGWFRLHRNRILSGVAIEPHETPAHNTVLVSARRPFQ